MKEGFWYSKQEQDLPKPVTNAISQEEADIICELIENKQNDPATERTYYKGLSFSRISGEPLGSGEFENGGWLWPDSLADHYVKEHRVKPSNEFLKFIGYAK